MRKLTRTLLLGGIAAAVAAFATGAALHAGDDQDEDAAQFQKIAKEALDKAIARGDQLFRSKEGVKKACASCHENPDKPQFNLATRPYAYPAYSVKAKKVVSLGQKINEMLVTKSVGKELDPKSDDLVALEAYVASLKKK